MGKTATDAFPPHRRKGEGMTTPDVELVEMVARAIFDVYDDPAIGRPSYAAAHAAITAITPVIRRQAMEEAARVVTEHYQELSTEHRLLLVNRAAAIRALMEKKQ